MTGALDEKVQERMFKKIGDDDIYTNPIVKPIVTDMAKCRIAMKAVSAITGGGPGIGTAW